MPGVLDGVKVLDLSWGIAGPVTGMLLADHGADVVKIEPPGGDPFRGTPGYDAWLRGRRSVELDLKDDDDRERSCRSGARRRRRPRELFARRQPIDWASTPRRSCGCNPRLIVCSITAYGDHPAHRDRPGYDALVAARLGILDEQRGHLSAGRSATCTARSRSSTDLEIPEGMAPGVTPARSDLHLHPVAEHGCGLPGHHRHQRRLSHEHTGRGQHVETSLLQAALALTASKWQRVGAQRRPGFRSWIYDRRAQQGVLPLLGRPVDRAVGAQSPVRALEQREGDRLERRSVTRAGVRDDPDRVPPDPENIVVLAHYFNPMAEAFARFPCDDVGRGGRRGRRPTAAGPHARGGARRTLPSWPRARSSTSTTPSTAVSARPGILYGLSRTPGRVQAAGTAGRPAQRARSGPRRLRAASRTGPASAGRVRLPASASEGR